MKLLQKLAIPAIAVGAALAGAPAAMAATSSAVGPAALSAVRVTNSPDSGPHWEYWNTYATEAACSTEGSELGVSDGMAFKCVQTEGIGGAYWQWDLYFWVG